jgi:hypothetical protein
MPSNQSLKLTEIVSSSLSRIVLIRWIEGELKNSFTQFFALKLEKKRSAASLQSESHFLFVRRGAIEL